MCGAPWLAQPMSVVGAVPTNAPVASPANNVSRRLSIGVSPPLLLGASFTAWKGVSKRMR